MLQIIDCITQDHDLRLVVLAGFLCLAACLAAVGMVTRAKASDDKWRTVWTAATGFVVGGAIWSTHFVAMLGFRPEIPFAYDTWLTLASVLIAITFSWLGVTLAVRTRHILAGGLMLGIAVITMHYVGMQAISLPGHLEWDQTYIFASVITGLAFGAAASMLALRGKNLFWRSMGGVAGALAICGTHFTSMAGVHISYDPTINISTSTIAPVWLGIGIFTITATIVALALLSVLIDHHLARRAIREAETLRAHVAELEATKKKLEETTVDLLKALEAAAASSQSKSQFLATMSHELRTPLNAIIGFSEILATELFGPLGNERYRDYANDVRESGSHLLSLINDILDFSKVDAGQLKLENENLAPDQVISEALRMMRQQGEQQGIRLEAKIDPELPLLYCDHRRVRQVLLNLLSNALKFTPSGGSVIVSAFCSNDQISLSVADTGIGMSAEDIPKALERFGQIDGALNRKYEGTGLGLPLAKGLIELHEGSLAIESELGVGTIVTARFPATRTIRNDLSGSADTIASSSEQAMQQGF